MPDLFQTIATSFRLGGPVMYPLTALSLLAAVLIGERTVFWSRHRLRRSWFDPLLARLRSGNLADARRLARRDRSIYGWFAQAVIDQLESGAPVPEHLARDLIESARGPLERFAVTLSTIITAAPLLGILGTVVGIINSFGLLGSRDVIADPAMVADGIAQALYTTAFGLIIALGTLFPYAWFRAQADRALARLEALAAIAASAQPPRPPADPPA